MKKVLIFFANGTEEIEALTPLDILRRAGADVTLCGVGGRELRGSHGIVIKTDAEAEALTNFDYDMVIVPGGLPGTTHLDECPVVEKALEAIDAKDGILAAICAAPLVLGKRGYLAGKQAVCYPGFEAYLKGAKLSTKKVVRDGNIVTAKGMGAAMEFSLVLTEMLFGTEKAESLATSCIAD